MTTRKFPIPTTETELWSTAFRVRRHEDAYFAFQAAARLGVQRDWGAAAEQFRANRCFAASSAAFRVGAEGVPGSASSLYISAGRDALRAGDKRVASLMSLRALEASQSVDVVIDAGNLLCSAGDFSNAAVALRNAAKLQPHNATVLSRLASIEAVYGSRSVATEFARAAASNHPQDRELQLQLASMLLWQHNGNGAPELLSEAEAAIRRASATQGPERDVAWRVAQLESCRGNSSHAIEIATSAMRGDDPEFRLAHFVVLERIDRHAAWSLLKDALNRGVGRIYRAMHERRFRDAYVFLKELTGSLRTANYLGFTARARYEQRLRCSRPSRSAGI
jgi:tetratricopeptide (TPR) repeat protein